MATFKPIGLKCGRNVSTFFLLYIFFLFAHNAKLCRLHRFYGRCVYTKAFRHPQMSTYRSQVLPAEVRYSSSHKVVIRQVSMAEFPGFLSKSSINSKQGQNKPVPTIHIYHSSKHHFFSLCLGQPPECSCTLDLDCVHC